MIERIYMYGAEVKRTRELLKMSVEEFADKINDLLGGRIRFVNPGQITRWEDSYQFDVDKRMFNVLLKVLEQE